MSVDFYPCKRCGEVYCDCGEFVTCNESNGGCGRDWCSTECAKADGHKKSYCKLEKDIDCSSPEGKCEFSKKDSWGYESCVRCDNFVPESCSYCRNEVYEDDYLLEKALEIFKITREDLIKQINNSK